MNPMFKSQMQYNVTSAYVCRDRPLSIDESASTATTSSNASDTINAWAEIYPLHHFAHTGNAQQLYAYIQRGYNANQADRYSWTPLHYAGWYNQLECVKMLI